MKTFGNFLRKDERGSATIWNLCWLLGFGAIMGVAVDTTAGMHMKAKLQAVADASSHAGAIDIFPFPTDAYGSAVSYGGHNIAASNVVRNQDITIGYWDDDARTFSSDAGTIPYYNAVQIDAARNSSRANAIATTLLKIAGIAEWDIQVASIARYSDDIDEVHDCRANGFLAGGDMEQTANNTIVGELCMHGEQSFKITQNNIVTCGVQMSTPSADNWQSGTAPAGNDGTCDDDYANLTNDEMVNQAFYYRSLKSYAQLEYDNVKEMLEAYVAGTPFNDPFVNTIPAYITRVDTVSRAEFNALSRLTGGSHSLVPGTLYHVTDCGTTGQTDLNLEGIVQNIGIYTACKINVLKDQKTSDLKPTKTVSGKSPKCDPDKNNCENVDWDLEIVETTCADSVAAGWETYVTMLDTAAGRTYRDGETTDNTAQPCAIEPGANGLWDNVFIYSTYLENGDRSQKAVTFPNNMQLGRWDGCTEGGGVRMYLAGSMDTPSGTTMNGLNIISLGDIHLAAKANGGGGVTVDSVGDVQYAAQGVVGGCPAGEEQLASDIVLTVRPIALVD